MSTIIQIADAVVQELNAETFSLPFQAERFYLPVFELTEMQVLHVTVVPRGLVVSQLSRAKSQHDYSVDIGIQQKLAKADNAEIDPLMQLVEELADFFRLRRLANFPAAVWTVTKNEPIYAIEHLNELRQFTSLLTLTFRVMR